MNRIDQAIQLVPRSEFLPSIVRKKAEFDRPLPIGFGQTNSQPSTVRTMLEWLDPQPGEKILDVGSGSGWTTALLAHLVGPNGVVHAVERIPELVQFGARNCERIEVQNVRFFKAEDAYGLPYFAPYDRILVSAAAPRLPGAFLEQLKRGGRLVVPVKDSIYVIDKINELEYKSTEHPGFLFVPLVQ